MSAGCYVAATDARTVVRIRLCSGIVVEGRLKNRFIRSSRRPMLLDVASPGFQRRDVESFRELYAYFLVESSEVVEALCD